MSDKPIQKEYEKRVQECIDLFNAEDETVKTKINELKDEAKERLDNIINGLKTGTTKEQDKSMFIFYAMLVRSLNYVSDHLNYSSDDYNTQATLDHLQGALRACQKDYTGEEK